MSEEKKPKMGKMKLNVYERMKLPELFPEKANYRDALIIVDIKEKINLKQKDFEKYGFQSVATPQGTRMTWNEKGNTDFKEVEFTEIESTLLKEGFDRLNDQKKVEPEKPFIDMCKKVVELSESFSETKENKKKD